MNATISQWLDALDDEKRELFITTLYSVIETMEVVNFSDLAEGWQKKATAALGVIKDIDPETRRFVLRAIRSLIALSVKNLKFPF